MEASLYISDCTDSITLEFYASDPKMQKERLKKVQLLINELKIIEGVLESFEFKSEYEDGTNATEDEVDDDEL